MRGEASATFGGLIGTIAHYLVLFGVAPAIGYTPDPFGPLADLNVFYTLVTYISVLAIGLPLAYHYLHEFAFEPGFAVGIGLVGVPVWVGFFVIDCLNAPSFAGCAAVTGLAGLLYGFLVAFSYDQFTGTL